MATDGAATSPLRTHAAQFVARNQPQNTKFEQVQTLLARGRVGLTQGWEGAAAEVSAAQQALVELRAGFARAQNVVPE